MALAIYAEKAETNDQVILEDTARYPYRLPDWFWESAQNADLLPPQQVISTRNDIAKLDELSNSSVKQKLEIDIAERLASKFSLHDLVLRSKVVTSAKDGVSLAVLIDPTFDSRSKIILQNAVLRFLEVAFDAEVIKKAFNRSTQTPSPMPTGDQSTDCAPMVDEIDLPKCSKYLMRKAKPKSIDTFIRQLHQALAISTVTPAVLMISRYSGDAWWGGAYNNFHSIPLQQLKREAPSGGYFYITLNSDKLKEPESGWNDPNFWASKIAHELLHNLGYWHPKYHDPKERDANNYDNEWAFIVSYEFAIREKLNSLKEPNEVFDLALTYFKALI